MLKRNHFCFQRAFKLHGKDAYKKGLESMIMYRLYKDAKGTIHETFTVLSVSLTLCQVQDSREEKVVVWPLFSRGLHPRGEVACLCHPVWQERIMEETEGVICSPWRNQRRLP